jgi:glycosyltransferase involved in cell wall biosynthesis
MNKVAVILPVYNKDKINFLQLAIESILCQGKCIDLIIPIDGFINQDIQLLLNSLNPERVVLLKYGANRGLAAVLNDAINYCLKRHYKFIVRMDADDISSPNRIQIQLAYFEKYPECDVLGSEASVINENGDRIGYKSLPERVTFSSLIWRCGIIHPSVIFRTSFFAKYGYYNTFYKKSQDYELWMRAIKKGAVIHNIKEDLLQLRYEKEIVIRRKKEQRFNIKIKMKYVPFYAKFFSVLPNIIMILSPTILLSYLARRLIK